MSNLLVDERPRLAGAPGAHVLIVGVSAYPHLPAAGARVAPEPPHYGLRALSSPALGAMAFWDWVQRYREFLPVPLATCRLLVLPSAPELRADPRLAQFKHGATVGQFQKAAHDWRQDAATHRDGMTIFYFAGHGIQADRLNHALVLEEYGDGIGNALKGSVAFHTLFEGMAPVKLRPDIARRQLYFVDACRQWLWAIEADEDDPKAQPALDVKTPAVDDRRAVRFFGAAPGTEAFGVEGEPTLYARTLVRCLEGAAAEKLRGRWATTAGLLAEALELLLEEEAREEGGEQRCWCEGNLAHRDEVVAWLHGHPAPCEVRMRVVPGSSVNDVRVRVRSALDQAPHDPPFPLSPHPFSHPLEPGWYIVGAERDAAPELPEDIVEARGPRVEWEARLGP